MSSKSKTDTIYLVPHTHYDAVWAFNKEDYFYINIELILKKVVELIEKTDYKFLIEQTYLLEEIETRNPQLFSQIKKFIQQGKIEIADGEYLMADTMLPNGETLVREILFGKRYVKEKFGIDVPVMWGADSFGYNAQLPQIYKKSGYRYFAFRRGADRDKCSEFWWQGLDGTKILTHWMPLGYRAGLDLTKLEESYQKLKKKAATEHILMPSGSGVTIPQNETSSVVKKWNRTHKTSKIKISRTIDFFEELKKEVKNLSTQKGELYSGKYSEVFPNCASNRIWLKQNLRKYENLILSCEKWTALAWLLGTSYPSDEFKQNWKKILFGAFHDVVPGTGIDPGYEEVKQNFSFLSTHLSGTFSNVLSIISQNLKNHQSIVIFNSLSWEVKNWVEVELSFSQGEIKKIEGLKSEKEELEVEILEFTRFSDDSLKTAKIGFVAKVPALGYKTYKILERNPQGLSAPKIKITGNTIQNQFFRLKVDPSTGLFDIFQNGELICKGNELLLEEEIGDLYYHRQNLKQPLKTESGEGIKYGQFKLKSFKIHKTPLRRVIDIESDYFSLRWPYRLLDNLRPLLWRHKFISISKKIIIYDDLPRIDFITTINNQHPQIRIRVKFSTNIKSSQYLSESQFGVVQRPVNQYYAKTKDWKEKPCGTYPSLNWIDYSDKQKGLTLINQGLPENEIRDNNIYLTLLRSVEMLSSDGVTGPAVPCPEAQEFKTYTFYYSVFPHSEDWKKSNCFKPAQEFNNLLIGFQLPPAEKSKKSLPFHFSFLEIKPENLILTALKKAEDSDEIILRFFETKGEKTQGEINLFKPPKQVKLVNLLEEEESLHQNLVWGGGKKIKLAIKPFEIITLKIKF